MSGVAVWSSLKSQFDAADRIVFFVDESPITAVYLHGRCVDDRRRAVFASLSADAVGWLGRLAFRFFFGLSLLRFTEVHVA